MLKPSVIFVLGAPGSGKGTVCQKLVEHFGFAHLSAGDLLVRHHEDLCHHHQRQGTCVPSSITVSVLENAMKESPNNGTFLIDGFPRNEENLTTWISLMGDKTTVKFVLFLDCREETCVERCLGRGRKFDSVEVLKARFAGHYRDSMPIVEHFEKQGLVRKIDTNRSLHEVFEDIKNVFSASQI